MSDEKQLIQDQQQDTATTTRCDICGDPVYHQSHAVHFRVDKDSQTVCESCVEELWDEVKRGE